MKTKVALITGGTSGIGRAAALAFARKGAKVAITGRRAVEGEQTIAFVREAGGEGLFIQADVSKEEDCRKMVEQTVKTFGQLNVAFNNAGVEGKPTPIVEETRENFQHVMDINVLGVIFSLKYQIPAMKKSGGGAIVINSSVAGVIGMPGVVTYVASKHAVLGVMKTAALEYAKDNIRVNAISPAAIQTDMYDRFTGEDEATKNYLKGLHPLGRVGTPDEIANMVVSLCSDDASFVTGTNLLVDGGFTAQ